jgi:hypothetical protein
MSVGVACGCDADGAVAYLATGGTWFISDSRFIGNNASHAGAAVYVDAHVRWWAERITADRNASPLGLLFFQTLASAPATNTTQARAGIDLQPIFDSLNLSSTAPLTTAEQLLMRQRLFSLVCVDCTLTNNGHSHPSTSYFF